MATTGLIVQILRDAPAGLLVMRKLDPETGLLVADEPQVSLRLLDLKYATAVDEGDGAVIKCKLRRGHITDGNDGLKKRFYLLATVAEDDETDDGHSDEESDIYFGGGGSSASRFRVKEVQEDYLVCRSWDGTTEGATDVLIAKAPELRHSLLEQTVNGVAITYSGHAIDGSGKCTRLASATNYNDQNEMVLPTWQTGNGIDAEIWAITPQGGTGVEVEIESVMTPLTWMDANVSARAWCQIG